jgi:prepilin-type N-terminal cleavage/methylation domain-containing protein
MLAIGKVDVGRLDQGFTLIEMLVVLAISGLISTLAYPAVERALDQRRFRGSLIAVLADLNATRATAVRSGTIVRFAVDPARGEFVGSGRARSRLETGIAIAAPSSPILFFKDGSSSGGSVSLKNSKLDVSVLIDATTGKITVRN